jgi:putative methyltransferase (TIGR04325 family)
MSLIQTSKCAPIALFAYARPIHLMMTVDSLKRNFFAKNSDLIIFSDGYKGEKDKYLVLAVREYLQSITGFASVRIIEREENFGLAKSILFGVSEVLKSNNEVIVLEDDLITSPYFLEFMNDGLSLYRNNNSVASIHGYLYPIEKEIKENFFLKGSDCWGWATWRRSWSNFNFSGVELLKQLKDSGQISDFDFDGTFNYSGMLKDQIIGKNNSWAIRWHAYTFLKNQYTLYPKKSLVKNIGLDGSGTHCSISSELDSHLSSEKIHIKPIAVQESIEGREAFKQYFIKRNKQNKKMINFKRGIGVQSLLNSLSNIFKNLFKINRKNYCEGNYKDWDIALTNSDGYDADEILRKTLSSTLKVKNGIIKYERDSVEFDEIEYSLPLLSGLLLAALKSKGDLRVLDYGGSLGSSFFQNKQYLQELDKVKWFIIEQPHYVDAGKQYIEDDIISFHKDIKSIEDSDLINFVLLSSVLPYIKSPYETLDNLLNLEPSVLVIDRTPFNIDPKSSDVIRIQHVPEDIYKASYPCRFFNEPKLIEHIQSRGYKLVEKFNSLDCFDERAKWKGFIFVQNLKENK